LVPLQSPEAVHEVTLVELQVSVDVAPDAMVAGVAVSVTVGADEDMVTVAVSDVDPLDPVQVSV
jgi:hypothetical protein